MISLYILSGNKNPLIAEHMFGIIYHVKIFLWNLEVIHFNGRLFMGTYIQLDEKEIKLLRDYVDDMIKLFGERDMIQEGEALYLSTEEIYVTRQDFEILRKKLR